MKGRILYQKSKFTVHDLRNRKDIQHLVDTFYKKVLADDVIGVFFTEVVQLNWDTHMPIMYDFWESTLFGTAKYKGNPMIKHMRIDEIRRLEDEHFDRWLALWKSTIGELFSGEKADDAIRKAGQIAELMKYKIRQKRFTL